jgi:hypothetical protein
MGTDERAAGGLQVRLPGRVGVGRWTDADEVIGCPEDDAWNRMPMVVILDEGFDGLRIVVWNATDEDVEDQILEHDNGRLAERWMSAADPSGGRGFHFWGRAAEVRTAP